MKAIYKREVRAYFKGLIGPVFIALFLAAAGVYTAYLNLVNRIPSFELSLYNMSIVFLIAIPLLTMRSFAQERRQNTDKLLYSSPVRVSAWWRANTSPCSPCLRRRWGSAVSIR